MESFDAVGVELYVGAEVACLLGDGRLRNTVMTTVVSLNPLILRARKGEVPRYECPREVVLVHYDDEKRYLRGDANLQSLEFLEDEIHMQLTDIVWEDVNRRRTPRIPVRIPVSLRAVYESKGTTVISVVEGYTQDLSVGGSRVKTSQPILEGSLVEFYAHLNDEDSVRALGVVAYHGEGSVGIAFLEYVAAARTKIEHFLKRKAA